MIKGEAIRGRDEAKELFEDSKIGETLQLSKVKKKTDDYLKKLDLDEQGATYVNPGSPVAYAHLVLSGAARQGDIESAYQAIRLLERASPKSLKRDNVLRKLNKAYNGACVAAGQYGEDDESDIVDEATGIYDKADAILMTSLERDGARKRGDYGWEDNHGGLERGVSATVAIIGLIGGLFFLSSNITGNVIGSGQSVGNIAGSVLLAVGLVAGFIWMRSSRVKK